MLNMGHPIVTNADFVPYFLPLGVATRLFPNSFGISCHTCLFTCSQLGTDDSWPCGDLTTKNQLRSPSTLPLDLVGSTELLAPDFDLGPSGGRQSALTAYTGTHDRIFAYISTAFHRIVRYLQ